MLPSLLVIQRSLIKPCAKNIEKFQSVIYNICTVTLCVRCLDPGACQGASDQMTTLMATETILLRKPTSVYDVAESFARHHLQAQIISLDSESGRTACSMLRAQVLSHCL